MTEPLNTHSDVWFGGFYELAIELGERSDDRLLRALRAIWSTPPLDGCYARNDLELDLEERVSIDSGLLDGTHLFGLARLPNGQTTVCGTFTIREVDDGPDWLGLYVPLGALADAYPVGGFPFQETRSEPQPWRDELDSWFRNIGMRVFDDVAYRFALIGFEVSGMLYSADIERDGIPDDRWAAMVVPSVAGLRYYPRTN